MTDLSPKEQLIAEHAARRQALEAKIARMEYFEAPVGGVICMLTLHSGFVVEGRTRCVDEEDGQGLAYTDALNNLWAFELYAEAEAMYAASVGGAA